METTKKTTMNFSAIKQKIIKTDEILQKFQEKIEEVTKLQKALTFKDAEIKKLTLENDRLSYNSNNYEALLTEHSTLKRETVRLEKEYHDTINTLQIKLQTASQELEISTVHPRNSPKSKRNVDEEFEKLRESYNKLQADFEDLQVTSALVNEKLNLPKEENKKIKEDRVKFAQENAKLKEKIGALTKLKSNQELETYELKKQLHDFKYLEDDFAKLGKLEEQLKETQKQLEEAKGQRQENRVILETLHAEVATLKTKNFKLVKENEEFENKFLLVRQNEGRIEELKEQLEITAKHNETLIQDNERLAQTLDEFKAENLELQNKLRNDAASPSDSYIREICEEMKKTTILISPVEDDISEDLMLPPPSVPVITITPPTPILTNNKEFTSSGSFSISSDVNVVKQKVKRRIRRVKKKKKVDLLATLRALKKANINFTISSSDIVSPLHFHHNSRSSSRSRPSTCSEAPRVLNPKQESKYVYKELSCSADCCSGKSYMVLQNDDEDGPLLGFLDIKSENSTVDAPVLGASEEYCRKLRNFGKRREQKKDVGKGNVIKGKKYAEKRMETNRLEQALSSFELVDQNPLLANYDPIFSTVSNDNFALRPPTSLPNSLVSTSPRDTTLTGETSSNRCLEGLEPSTSKCESGLQPRTSDRLSLGSTRQAKRLSHSTMSISSKRFSTSMSTSKITSRLPATEPALLTSSKRCQVQLSMSTSSTKLLASEPTMSTSPEKLVASVSTMSTSAENLTVPTSSSESTSLKLSTSTVSTSLTRASTSGLTTLNVSEKLTTPEVIFDTLPEGLSSSEVVVPSLSETSPVSTSFKELFGDDLSPTTSKKSCKRKLTRFNAKSRLRTFDSFHQNLPFESDKICDNETDNGPDGHKSVTSRPLVETENLSELPHLVIGTRKSPRTPKPIKTGPEVPLISEKGTNSPTYRDPVAIKKRIARTPTEISTSVAKLNLTRTSPRKRAFKKPICARGRGAKLVTLPAPDASADPDKVEEYPVFGAQLLDLGGGIDFAKPRFGETNPEVSASEEVGSDCKGGDEVGSDCPASPPPVEHSYSAAAPKIIPLELLSPPLPTAGVETDETEELAIGVNDGNPSFGVIEATNTDSGLCVSEDSDSEDSQASWIDEDELEGPLSPPSVEQSEGAATPKKIPLEKIETMPPSKVVALLQKLINYSKEEKALDEVVGQFLGEEPAFIAEVILERISEDYHDKPDNVHETPHAPLLTETQRIMLGFMLRLEKNNVKTIDHFLLLAERELLTCKDLEPMGPITRLYMAICKLKKDLHRMRRLCCEVFYFCGDLALPFFYTVLTSWTEVLPHAIEDVPLARVLVQLIHMKNCNTPGYNSMPLRDLLGKFYRYPMERWSSDELFQELFDRYQRNPVRSSDFALLLLCKHHPEKWVHDKIHQCFKPFVDKITTDNFKATVIILVGNLSHRFSKTSEFHSGIREWFRSLIGENTSDVVKRSVYLCLNRLGRTA